MEKQKDNAQRAGWSLQGIEGAAIRNGKVKNLDQELEMPRQEIVDLHIPVLAETYEGLKEVIAANGWEEEEGLRTMLVVGLGYTRVKTIEQSHDRGEIDDREYRTKLSDLARLVTQYEANYSVMKFKAFQFQEKSRILEMRVSGLEGTERLREAWALRVRDRLEALEAEQKELEQRLDQRSGTQLGGVEEDRARSAWWKKLRDAWSEYNSDGRKQGEKQRGAAGDTETGPAGEE